MNAILRLYTFGHEANIETTAEKAVAWVLEAFKAVTPQRITVTLNAQLQITPETEAGFSYASTVLRNVAVVRFEFDEALFDANAEIEFIYNEFVGFIHENNLKGWDTVPVYYRLWSGGGKGSTLLSVDNAPIADVVEYFTKADDSGVIARSADGKVSTDGKRLFVEGQIVAVKVR